ncbi:uncharacterized protein LOC108672095 [Hyalella azteca]|uniref:Uncharacterized protein LOC108672095 n=1 Tax=Hyalella azteca TaxID=294128 RepID=A0A8B7NNE3_HYAAZ|nr:uncharacterized protein LOC108672095 [Hyalella azteca]
MSLSFIKEEPQDGITAAEFCTSPRNLLEISTKDEPEETAKSLDCGVDTFLNSVRDYNHPTVSRNNVTSNGTSRSPISLASSFTNPSSFLSPCQDASYYFTHAPDLQRVSDSRSPRRLSPALPIVTYTEDEVKSLVQLGQCRLVKMNSKSRIWQHFERVFNEFGQDTTYVVCLSCRNLLKHKLTSTTAPLVAHVQRCSGHRIAHDSPESPGSRSSESASPQLPRDDFVSQPQLFFPLFSPEPVTQDHQKFMWRSPPNALSPQNPSQNAANMTIFPSFDPISALRPQLSPFGHAPQTPSPHFPFNTHDGVHFGGSAPLNSRKPRRSRHKDVFPRQTRHPGDTVRSGTSRNTITGKETSLNGSNDSQEAGANGKSLNLAYKAALDAAVAFCCLDGRWFDDIRGSGLRELCQAFLNIGAQCGTLLAEKLLPSASDIRHRAADMAALKRSLVAAELAQSVASEGGCLAVATTRHEDGRTWVSCRLHVAGRRASGALVGTWPYDGSGRLRQQLRGALALLGLQDQTDQLIILGDSVAYPLRSGPPKPADGPATGRSPPSGGRKLTMADPVPCGRSAIQDLTSRILNHSRLCRFYGDALATNLQLIKDLRNSYHSSLAAGACDVAAQAKVYEDFGVFNLSQVKFTYQRKKEIENLFAKSCLKASCSEAISSSCKINSASNIDESSRSNSFKSVSECGDIAAVDNAVENTKNAIVNSNLENIAHQTSKAMADFAILSEICDYFEPFDAALRDLDCSDINEPSLGKFLPWVKTLRQYSADAEKTLKNNTSDSKLKNYSEESSCIYCKSSKKVKPDISLPHDGRETESCDSYTGATSTNAMPLKSNSCLSLHEVGFEVVTNFLIAHPAHFVATFLTPHFKSLAMLDAEETKKTLSWVKKLASDISCIGSDFWIPENYDRDAGITSNQTRILVSDVNEINSATTHVVEKKNNESKFDNTLKIISLDISDDSKTSRLSNGVNDLVVVLDDKSMDEDSAGEKQKNPTLKALLEDDSSNLYQKPPVRSCSRPRGHPTLVSLLESNMTVSPTAKRCMESLQNNGSETDGDAVHKKLRIIPDVIFGRDAHDGCSADDGKKDKIQLNHGDFSEDRTVPSEANEAIENSSGGFSSGIVKNNEKNRKYCTDVDTSRLVDTHGSSHGSRSKSRFTSIAHYMQSNPGDQNGEDSPVDLELSRYQGLPFPPSGTATDEWWRQKGPQLPTLAALARRLLSVPVTVTAIPIPDGHRRWPRQADKTEAEDTVVNDINNLMFLAADW